MILKIHDLPTRYPMDGVSFRASKDAIDRIIWTGKVLELVLVTGEVWRLDFDAHQWKHTQTIGAQT